MSNLLEKLNGLKLLQNENKILNAKITKIKLQKLYLDEGIISSYQNQKSKIQEDLVQYTINSNIINISKNNTIIQDRIPELLKINTIECSKLSNIEELTNVKLIRNILNDSNILQNSLGDGNSIDNSIDNSNIEISENVLLQIYESNTFQELNKNLKNIELKQH